MIERAPCKRKPFQVGALGRFTTPAGVILGRADGPGFDITNAPSCHEMELSVAPATPRRWRTAERAGHSGFDWLSLQRRCRDKEGLGPDLIWTQAPSGLGSL